MKTSIKTLALALMMGLCASAASAQAPYAMITDPDGMTTVYVGATDGVAWYSVDHGKSLSLPASRLGLMTNAFDYSELTMTSFEEDEIIIDYTMDRTKTGKVNHRATTGTATFANPKGEKIMVEFVVSRNDVAFRYLLPKEGETGSVRVMDELTEFNFIESEGDGQVKTYLTPQSDAMIGWKRTKPSYEEYYGIGFRRGFGAGLR